jgi:hypothetical protein
MPRETAEDFAKRVWALMQNCYMNDVAEVIAARDRETAEEMRERARLAYDGHHHITGSPNPEVCLRCGSNIRDGIHFRVSESLTTRVAALFALPLDPARWGQ